MDPRIARTHAAVMEAAADLLVEGGPAALTMDGVVARSGVAKSTLYRHWATRDDLVADVFASCAPVLDPPAEGATCEEALRDLARAVTATMADERWSRLAPALMLLSAQHQDLARVDSDLKQAQNDELEAIFRLGVDEGILDPRVLDDLHLSVALLAGPIIATGLARLTDLDVRLADASVDQFLAAHRPPT